ncbi:hypothetical protein OAR76_00610 [Candidatus Pelagibacter sp.]|nr:hypothetical protein [Candidatus Pelagibacter sp.]
MIKIGIVPCQNGLGHISRSIDLANKLSTRYSIFFISNLKKNKKFKINKSIKKIQFIFDFPFKEKKYNQFWYKKLESKIKSLNIDILISDNLPEIIFLKYKSIIISNFFWHEIFNIKNKKLKKTLEILKSKKIKIFRNKIFKDQKNFSNIGFIGPVNKKKKLDDGLLISFGSDDLMSNSILEEIEKIIYNKTRKITLHLDPKYYKKKYMKFNVVMATYSDEMFDKIKYAIIKPGFGLIKDCLKNKVLIFSYLNPNFNQEFFNNANALKKNKLGFVTKSLIKSYQTIKLRKVTNINYENKHFFNGENDIIKYIESVI